MTQAQEDGLNVAFDLLASRPEELYYSIFHFDQYWSPNDLRPEEFITGFQENLLNNYVTSRRTKIPYVHYRFYIPSNLFLVTGNYLVCVSDRNKNVLFTRRFYVSANNVLVSVQFRDPVNVSLQRTHQALEITVNTNKKIIPNNGKELSIHIFQNGDPNTLLSRTIPNIYIDDKFYFTKPDDILYKAIKEFRHKDMRTLISITQDIIYWDEQKDFYHCWLIPDDIRVYKSPLTDYDINGRYLVLNRDVVDADIESDYIMAHFTLNSREYLPDPVYLYGSMTNWRCTPDFEMEYDPSRNAYQVSALLKMGYYNYLYAVMGNKKQPDTSPLEGDWYETENDYNVLVYYRPFGSRYDQLLFAGEFNSNR